MKPAVDLIIPDSGPLISLAHANRLDLVEVFDRPVAVLDVVKLECLKKREAPDYEILKSWFDRSGNAVRIVDTPLCATYQKALEDERSGRNPRATRGLGDATFGWLLPNLGDVVAPGAIPLVLLEDRNLSLTLDLGLAHILSTRAWLSGLERAGVIESAAEVIEQINRHGRNLSTLQADRPVERDNRKSGWIGAVVGKRRPAGD